MAWFARLVYASRISQILFALIVTGLSVPLSNYIYSGTNPFFAATAACSAVVLLDGYIGFFAFKRPNDVHWHLTLTFDWLGCMTCLALCGIFTMFAVFAGAGSISENESLVMAATVFSYFLLCATVIPLVWTYRLKARGQLPPPSSKRDYWYHMEDHGTAST